MIDLLLYCYYTEKPALIEFTTFGRLACAYGPVFINWRKDMPKQGGLLWYMFSSLGDSL